jgi:hypothetical protein
VRRFTAFRAVERWPSPIPQEWSTDSVTKASGSKVTLRRALPIPDRRPMRSVDSHRWTCPRWIRAPRAAQWSLSSPQRLPMLQPPKPASRDRPRTLHARHLALRADPKPRSAQRSTRAHPPGQTEHRMERGPNRSRPAPDAQKRNHPSPQRRPLRHRSRPTLPGSHCPPPPRGAHLRLVTQQIGEPQPLMGGKGVATPNPPTLVSDGDVESTPVAHRRSVGGQPPVPAPRPHQPHHPRNRRRNVSGQSDGAGGHV